MSPIRQAQKALTPLFNRWRLLLLLLILGGGTLLVWWLVQEHQLEIKVAMLHDAELVAQALNTSYVKRLLQHPNETSPLHRRLKQQLSNVKKLDRSDARIYLLTCDAGKHIKLLVGDHPTGPANELLSRKSQPLLIAQVIKVFATKKAAVIGPLNGGNEMLFAALVPVIDLDTGKVIAVMGVSTKAEDYYRDLIRSIFPTILVVVALLLCALIGAWLQAKRARSSLPPSPMMRYLELVLTVVIGLILTVYIVWLTNHLEFHAYRESFRSIAQSKVAVVARTFLNIQNVELEGLARFYEGTDTVQLWSISVTPST